jgi:hypothetical protein
MNYPDQTCYQVDGAGAPGGPSKAEPGAGSAGRGAAGAAGAKYGPIRQCNDLIDVS